jgi:hypothetical protein
MTNAQLNECMEMVERVMDKATPKCCCGHPISAHRAGTGVCEHDRVLCACLSYLPQPEVTSGR